MNHRLALTALAAATFLVAFAVAELTGVRAIGGVILLAGGIWCARLALRLTGATQTVALLIIALALFVVSHPLGKAIGSWPAVLLTASATAAAAGIITWIWRKTDTAGMASSMAVGEAVADDRMDGGFRPDRR